MSQEQQKLPQPSTPVDLQDFKVAPKKTGEISQSRGKFMGNSNWKNFEVVYVFERISQIISPYFLIIAGLIIYEQNFLLGMILIVTGTAIILKISWEDVITFIEGFKSLFGLNKPK